MKRKSPRESLFDLGDVYVDREAASLLSQAQVRQVLDRHHRGDWGDVSPPLKKRNDQFRHPKQRAPGTEAGSVHVIANTRVAILTKQGSRRRKTYLFLLSP